MAAGIGKAVGKVVKVVAVADGTEEDRAEMTIPIHLIVDPISGMDTEATEVSTLLTNSLNSQRALADIKVTTARRSRAILVGVMITLAGVVAMTTLTVVFKT